MSPYITLYQIKLKKEAGELTPAPLKGLLLLLRK
jgi:hypothetical protein